VCCLSFSITGLTAIVRSNCTENEPRVETNLAWSDYINPCALLLLYFYFAFETNRTFFHKVNFILFVILLVNDIYFKVQSNTTTMQSIEQQVDMINLHGF
jgi:hypothetical protein